MQDVALLRRYSESGSEDAFGAFVSDNLQLVYGAALRRVGGDAHLAQDVAQLVFTAAARDAARLARHPDIAGWLFTTTRFLAAKVVRTEQRRRVRDHAAWRERGDARAGEEWKHEQPVGLQLVLDDVLMELQQLDRQMLLMRFYRGLRLAEIGAQLNSSENAVQKRIERALERLKEKLTGRGITSTAAALAAALEAFGSVSVPAGLATAAATAGVACGAGGTIAAAGGMAASTKAVLWCAAAVAVATTGGVAWYQRENARLQAELAKQTAARAAADDAARRELERAALALAASKAREDAAARQTAAAAPSPRPTIPRSVAPTLPPPQASPILPRTLPAGMMVPLRVRYPRPLFAGTPRLFAEIANLEPVDKKEREIMVPGGTALISRGALVTSSDPLPVIGELAMITDGDKSGTDGAYVELGPGLQWVQIDLGKTAAIHAVAIWHFHAQPRVYRDVIVRVANDADFRGGAGTLLTLFNNDDDGSARFGKGKDQNYVETFRGKIIDARGVAARYVRIYSNGNTSDPLNHYCEVEVFGIPQP